MILLPGADAIAFIPLVHDGIPGGPNITPCSGWIVTENAPLALAGVPIGETHSVIVADGLNTYSPERVRLNPVTSMLTLLTNGVGSALGLGLVLTI